MDVILIPGFWLDASSWDDVSPALVAAGHRVHALTLPGLESVDADRSGIGLRDHVDAVVATIDSVIDGAIDAIGGGGEADGVAASVVLVGHSGGGAIAYAAVDARPDRVARTIYVDSLPLGPGGVINDQLPVVDGDIPLPAWDVFDEEDLVDLDDEARAAFRARSIPQPRAVASDAQVLSDERRLDVAATVVACEFSAAQVRGWQERGEEALAELSRIRNVEIVELPTGHWPQFTRPAELGAVLVAAIGT